MAPKLLAKSCATARIVTGRRLRSLLSYARKVYDVTGLLGQVTDSRTRPVIATAIVARIVLLVGLLRVRSFNALEPKLAEPQWRRLLGLPDGAKKICSVDAIAYVLQRVDVDSVRSVLVAIVKKAERNKILREGWHGALRFVAIDGWEPFCSRSRCCDACLTRQITIGEGKHKRQVTEYYHHYVVAMLLDEHLELVLDMEQVRSADMRQEAGDVHARGHEGELTAAKRLVQRLRDTYGRLLDVLVCDALYSNGPFLSVAKDCGFGVIAVAKKTTDEPLKDALAIWGRKPPQQSLQDDDKHERIELWDCPGVQTLETYDGPIRVVRALVHKPERKTPHQWCFAVTGKAAKLPSQKVLSVGRARWHIENTGFAQWTLFWPLAHVFTHGIAATTAMLWFFFVAFNLMQLFVYRQLGGYGRDCGRDVTRTFLRLVDEMRDELARLTEPVAWDSS
jgi:uncharacterized protein YdbL (DUF1318 family)